MAVRKAPMKSQKPPALFLAFTSLTLIFTLLFYHSQIGTNLLVYSLLVLFVFNWLKPLRDQNRLDYFVQLGFLGSALALFIHDNNWSIFVTMIFGFGLVGRLAEAQLRSLAHSLFLGLHAFFFSFGSMFDSWGQFNLGRLSFRKLFRSIRIVLIPFIVILFFLLVYRFASPGFKKFLSFFDRFFEQVLRLLELIDINILLLLVLGGVFHAGLVYFSPSKWLVESDVEASDAMLRRPHSKPLKSKPMDLLVEYKSGVFLLVTLNLMLLIVNFFDIKNVWFKFSWEGQYLKEYVHHGAGILLLSILISIVIVLYYFRGNLNFYKQNKVLKLVSLIWLVQNAVLTLSVGARTMQYISHYNLAYLRIALLFFLLLTLFGILTVGRKIMHKKSAFYLIRYNSLAWALVMFVSTWFDWNAIIARYNLRNHDHAFTHFEFLYDLPDACLDDLNLSKEEALVIDQNRVMPSKKRNRTRTKSYMSAEMFQSSLKERQDRFMRDFPNRDWRSWTLAEQLAYNRLKSQK